MTSKYSHNLEVNFFEILFARKTWLCTFKILKNTFYNLYYTLNMTRAPQWILIYEDTLMFICWSSYSHFPFWYITFHLLKCIPVLSLLWDLPACIHKLSCHCSHPVASFTLFFPKLSKIFSYFPDNAFHCLVHSGMPWIDVPRSIRHWSSLPVLSYKPNWGESTFPTLGCTLSYRSQIPPFVTKVSLVFYENSSLFYIKNFQQRFYLAMLLLLSHFSHVQLCANP